MIKFRVESDDLRTLARSLNAEADGKKLRRDLAKNIRLALAPAVSEAKAGIMAMGSSGLSSGEGGPLRAAIARQVKPEARLSGRAPGARVRVKKRQMPRGFLNAPKRTNRAKGWRHPVYGHDRWVEQLGRPDWFDEPMKKNAPTYRAAVLNAMEDAAQRITRRI